MISLGPLSRTCRLNENALCQLPFIHKPSRRNLELSGWVLSIQTFLYRKSFPKKALPPPPPRKTHIEKQPEHYIFLLALM